MMNKDFFKILITSAKVQMSQTFSRPMFKYIIVVQPFFYSLMLWMIYKESSYFSFVSYVLVGTGALTLWSSIIFSSASDIDREKFIGTMVYITATPTKFTYILLGKILGNTVLGIIPIIISTYCLLNISSHSITVVSPSYLFFSFFLSFITYISIAFFLCLLFTLSREIRVFMNFLIYPIYILCGIAFPIEILPKSIKYISYLLPPTWTLKIIRDSILNQPKIFDIITLLVLLLFYNILTYFFLKKFYKDIRINATLEVF